MSLDFRRFIDGLFSSLIYLIPEVVILILLTKVIFPNLSLLYLAIGLICYHLVRKLLGKISYYIYWCLFSKNIFKETFLERLKKGNYPKIPRNGESCWQYLENIFKDQDIDITIRLDACSLATDVDTMKKDGLINSHLKEKTLCEVIDDYVSF